jgi:hypothetical protein
MKTKTTKWISGKQKPTIKGVYQRIDSANYKYFSYWNGKYWGVCCSYIDTAPVYAKMKSIMQDMDWRGLMEQAK